MASPYGFNRGLPNRRARIIANSTQRAQAAQQRAARTGPFNATASIGPRPGIIRGGQGPAPLSPKRIQSLTTKLQGLKAERRGLPAPAIGDPGTLPGTGQTRQDEIYKAIRQIRGTLKGRRNTPMPTPTPGTPSPGLVPGTHIPIGDIGIPGIPGSYPPGRGPTPSGGVIQGGKPGNQDRIRAIIGQRGYRGRPIGR